MGKRGTSIIDIAHMAGVSKATVSNVLNGTGRVGEKTRARVLEIAEREGYVANFAAKSLRASETRTVGIITPDISNAFFSSVVLCLERSLYNAGYTSFICDTENDPEREASYVRSMLQKQVDGLAFVSCGRPLDISTLPEGIPVVTIDRRVTGVRGQLALVDNDVRRMSHDMTKTLLEHGKTRLALLSISASEDSIEENVRYLGYVEALAEAGVQLDRRLVLRGRHERPSNIEAYQLVNGLLEEGIPLDGVAAMGDRVAIGAINALRDHGVSVGSDVLVIGCDNSPVAELLNPQLSSVDRLVDELALRAAETLTGFMGGTKAEYARITVPHKVVERSSTLGI